MGSLASKLKQFMKEEGITKGFLANRLYKPMGYENPGGANDFVRGALRNDFSYRDSTPNISPALFEARQAAFMKKVYFFYYAMGVSEEEGGYRVADLPENAVSYEQLKLLQQALQDPSNADLKLLSQLTLDEKLGVMSDDDLGTVEGEVDRLLLRGNGTAES